MEATLKRIDQVNDKVNAIICMKPKEDLIRQAKRMDMVHSDHNKGWLRGIPVAIKDLSNVTGFPTTYGGSQLFKDFHASFNDPYVQKLVAAGVIVIGKTNVPENGVGSHTYNPQWGTTRNPFDLSRSAGGSSGGAAVAIATGMLPFADGTDMMGSLRNPAGWNNIYSHRPTAGWIAGSVKSKWNPLEYPISTPGPMAKTPLDLALLLETMVRNNDLFSAAPLLQAESKYGDSIDNKKLPTFGNQPLRIGWLGDWGGSYPFEDGIISLCQSALDAMVKHRIATVDDLSQQPIFPATQLWTSWNHIRFALTAANVRNSFDEEILLGDDSPIKPELQFEIRQGNLVTKEDIDKAATVAEEYHACLNQVFQAYDVLALPSAQVWPFPAEWTYPTSIAGTAMDTYHRWMEVCVPVSFGGLPCTTVPAGFRTSIPNEDGRCTDLPMGLTLFAKRDDDLKLLQLAQVYHKVTNWPSKVIGSEDGDADSLLKYKPDSETNL